MSERSRQVLASSTQQRSSDLITATMRNSTGGPGGDVVGAAASSSHPSRHSSGGGGGGGQRFSKGRRTSRVREAHDSEWAVDGDADDAALDRPPSPGRSSRSRPRQDTSRRSDPNKPPPGAAADEEEDHDFQFSSVVIPPTAAHRLPTPVRAASPTPKRKPRASARRSAMESMSFTAAEASRTAVPPPRIPLHAAVSGSRPSASLARSAPAPSSVGALSSADMDHLRDNIAAAPEPMVPIFRHSAISTPAAVATASGGVQATSLTSATSNTFLSDSMAAQQQERARRPESIVTIGRQQSSEPPSHPLSSSQSVRSPALRSVTSPLHLNATLSFRLGSPVHASSKAQAHTSPAAAGAPAPMAVNSTLASIAATAWTQSRNSPSDTPSSPRIAVQRPPPPVHSGRYSPPPPPPPTPPHSATKGQPPAAKNAYVNRTGFLNDGNTCYAASVLSMLLRLNEFQEGLEAFMRRYRSVLFRHRMRRDASSTPPPTPMRPGCRVGAVAFDQATDAYGGNDATIAASPASPTTAAVESYSMLGPSTNDSSACMTVAEDVLGTATQESTSTVVEVAPLHHALAEVVATLRSPHLHDTINGVSVQRIANAMGRYALGDMFFDGDQHDAHEFFVSLVALIEAEAVNVMKRKVKKQMRNKRRREEGEGSADARGDPVDVAAPTVALEDVWINRLLQGAMCNLVACRRAGCELLQVTSEHFVNVSLAIPDPQGGLLSAASATTARSTAALLRDSLAPVALDDYKCDKCHVKRHQFQGACVSRAPQVLVVQWKRFDVVRSAGGAFGVRKDLTPVQLDPRLVVVERDQSNAQGAASVAGGSGSGNIVTEVTYALRSVVLHLGQTLFSGHYICAFWDDSTEEEDAVRPERSPTDDDENADPISLIGHRWMFADDDIVRRINDRTMERLVHGEGVPQCYLAVYVEVRRRVVPDVGQGAVRFVAPVVEAAADADALSRDATAASTTKALVARLDSGATASLSTISARDPSAPLPRERSPTPSPVTPTVTATPPGAASRPKRGLLQPYAPSNGPAQSQGGDEVESWVGTPPSSPSLSRADPDDVVL